MINEVTEFWKALSSLTIEHSNFFINLSYFLMGVGVVQNLIYLIQLPLAYFELRIQKYREIKTHSWRQITSNITIPISILVPAYNEELTIVENILSMLSLKYPDFEVIVINDGSKDNTFSVLKNQFKLKTSYRSYETIAPHKPIKNIYTSSIHRNLIVIDKENGGSKADAINAGLNVARYSLFCTVDADSILEADALLKAVQPFIDKPDTMIAVGGSVRIANGCAVINGSVAKIRLPKKLLSAFQVVEYIRAFLIGRLAWSRAGILTIISGAFGVFKRSVALKVGGYSTDTLGEDFELILKMHSYLLKNKIPYDIQFIPEPVCWTEVPETLSVLKKQRLRWQRGAFEGFFKHIYMLFNPYYGRVGIIGFPVIFIMDILGPLVEAIGYILIPAFSILGIIDFDQLLAFIALYFFMGVFISMCSLILEEISLRRFPRSRDIAILASLAILENFGYRQLNNIWRVQSLWQYIMGTNKGWGQMSRTGFIKE